MNIHRNIFRLLLISLFFFSLFPQFAVAQSVTGTARREEAVEARCTRVTTRIDGLITRLQNEESTRQTHHQNVIDRLNTLISKLNAKNVNTDKLKSDVDTLIAKKATWQQAFDTLLSKLNATKQFACGQSQGQFVQAVKDSEAARKSMHQENLDFWSFVTNTVKTDIQAIRNEVKTK